MRGGLGGLVSPVSGDSNIQKPHPKYRNPLLCSRIYMNTTIPQSGETAETGKETGFILVRWAAQLVSVVFHPVFVPVYVIAFLLFIHPFQFTGFSPQQKVLVLGQAVAMYLFFPLVTVLLLKALHFIQSIRLERQKDRIIPLVACGIWYFWVWYVWRNLPEYPKELVHFALAIWISSWAALMINVRMKISLHAISLGISLAFLLRLAFTQDISFGFYLAIALLITGLVCTARFIVSDHTETELYSGLLVGAVSVLVAGVFV